MESGEWKSDQVKNQSAASIYRHLSDEAIDLIDKIIKPEGKRIGLDEILNHPWMNLQ